MQIFIKNMKIQSFTEFWLESGLPLAKAQSAYRDFVAEIATQVTVGK